MLTGSGATVDDVGGGTLGTEDATAAPREESVTITTSAPGIAVVSNMSLASSALSYWMSAISSEGNDTSHQYGTFLSRLLHVQPRRGPL